MFHAPQYQRQAFPKRTALNNMVINISTTFSKDQAMRRSFKGLIVINHCYLIYKVYPTTNLRQETLPSERSLEIYVTLETSGYLTSQHHLSITKTGLRGEECFTFLV